MLENHWDSEPDLKHFYHGGYLCIIRRNPSYGHLCGYIGLSSNHPLCGVSYFENSVMNLEVHGGITYSEEKPPMELDISSYYSWFLGFDCAHAGDYSPGLSSFGDPKSYKDMEFVASELISLARQLADME